MIANALIYELKALYPDYGAFWVHPDDDDEVPPYFVVNLVNGEPKGSGLSGRWQIRIVSSDKEGIESEVAKAVRDRFHDQSGKFGEPGSEESFQVCGVVFESAVSRGEGSGVYYKDIDLKIFYS